MEEGQREGVLIAAANCNRNGLVWYGMDWRAGQLCAVALALALADAKSLPSQDKWRRKTNGAELRRPSCLVFKEGNFSPKGTRIFFSLAVY